MISFFHLRCTPLSMDSKSGNSRHLIIRAHRGHEFGFFGFSDDETRTHSKSAGSQNYTETVVLTQSTSPTSPHSTDMDNLLHFTFTGILSLFALCTKWALVSLCCPWASAEFPFHFFPHILIPLKNSS